MCNFLLEAVNRVQGLGFIMVTTLFPALFVVTQTRPTHSPTGNNTKLCYHMLLAREQAVFCRPQGRCNKYFSVSMRNSEYGA
jgi:hypothetical protein